MIGIYKIENLINHKVYIGQSRNISKRWKNHRYLANSGQDTYLYRAMNKYGIENFQFTVIEQCSIEQLDEREKYWIKYFQSNDREKGYNLTSGGEGNDSLKLSKEDIFQIHKDLLQMSQKEIANKYNIDQSTISRINTGESYLIEGISYPIRNYFEKEIKKCVNCGKEVYGNNLYCHNCAMKNRRKVERPNRDELKKLIRTKSFLEIGKEFGVSDNAIRKWCKSENLPSKKTEIKLYSDEDWDKI